MKSRTFLLLECNFLEIHLSLIASFGRLAGSKGCSGQWEWTWQTAVTDNRTYRNESFISYVWLREGGWKWELLVQVKYQLSNRGSHCTCVLCSLCFDYVKSQGREATWNLCDSFVNVGKCSRKIIVKLGCLFIWHFLEMQYAEMLLFSTVKRRETEWHASLMVYMTHWQIRASLVSSPPLVLLFVLILKAWHWQ